MAASVNVLREAAPQKDNCKVTLGLLLLPVVVGVELPQAARSSMVSPARPLSPSWHTCLLVYEILLMCLYLLICRRSVANVPAMGLANDRIGLLLSITSLDDETPTLLRVKNIICMERREKRVYSQVVLLLQISSCCHRKLFP